MDDFNERYPECNDLGDTSGDYTKRTTDENADPYTSSGLGSSKKTSLNLSTALKMMTTAASVTLVGAGVATGVIEVIAESELPVGTEVTVYLDIGDIGLFEGKAGYAISEPNLSYGVKLTTKVGDPLPGSDKITTSTGQTFKEWHYYKNKASVEYTVEKTVLGYDNLIYVASYNNDAPPPEPDYVTYTVNDIPSWVTEADYTFLAMTWTSANKQTWYPVTLSGTSMSVNITQDDAIGMNLVACYQGSTKGDWSNRTTDKLNRIYLQSKNINLSSGKTTYSSPDWLYFPNDYPGANDKRVLVVTGIPSHIYTGDYTYFVWIGGVSFGEGYFLKADFLNSSTMVMNIPKTGATSVNLVAAYKGTTEPVWDKGGSGDEEYIAWHAPGRIYYQTKNLFLTGATKQATTDWIAVPNDYS